MHLHVVSVEGKNFKCLVGEKCMHLHAVSAEEKNFKCFAEHWLQCSRCHCQVLLSCFCKTLKNVSVSTEEKNCKVLVKTLHHASTFMLFLWKQIHEVFHIFVDN